MNVKFPATANRARTSVLCWILLPLLAVVGFSMLMGCSRDKEGGNYTHVESDDAAMNAAIEKAKNTVGEFVTAFHAQKPNSKDFFVKKPYPTPKGEHEHMWI